MFLFLLSQVFVQDAGHPIDFFDIALNRTGQLFWVVPLEINRLSVVRPLSGYLENEPLFRMIILWCSGSKTQPVFGVIALDQILENGTGFPQSEAGIGVLDSWHAAIRVDGEEIGLLDLRELERDNLVGEAELGKDDGDFGRIGPALTPDLDGFDLRRHFLFSNAFKVKMNAKGNPTGLEQVNRKGLFGKKCDGG